MAGLILGVVLGRRTKGEVAVGGGVERALGEQERVAEAEERGRERGTDAEPREDGEAAGPEEGGDAAEDSGERMVGDEFGREEETDQAEDGDGGADGDVLGDGEAAVDRRECGEVFIPVGRYRREAGEGERHEVKRAGETEAEGPEVVEEHGSEERGRQEESSEE